MKIEVNDICDNILKNGDKFVLISGNGGAGKSTLAKVLQNKFLQKNKTVNVISTDDFMLDKVYRKNTIKTYLDKNGQTRSGYMTSTFPEAYDYDLLKKTICAQDADIIIVEGIGAALILADFKESYKIFVQVDKETEFQRRAQRARSGADLSRERMEIRYEQFELFILPLADKFDLKLISQDDFSYIIQAD